MKVVMDFENTYVNVKIIRKILKREYEEEYPSLLKWSMQFLFKKDKGWIEICRIDNYPHEGEARSHIHHSKGKVEWYDCTPQEAFRLIKELGRKMVLDKCGEDIGELR